MPEKNKGELIVPEKDKNELIVVKNMQPMISTNPDFQRIVASIKQSIDRAEPLLKVPLNQLDEDQLTQSMAELKQVQTQAKLLATARARVKKRLDQNTANILKQLDDILIPAGYDRLMEINAKIKQRKNDQLNARKDKRWKKLRQHWFSLMKNVYTNVDPTRDLSTMMPNITFNEFQQQHLKLVSGAKTRDIREKDLKVVSDYLNHINNDFMAILALNSPFQNKLIDYYQSTRDLPTVLKYNQQLKEQAAEAARQQKEHDEQLKKQLAMQQQAQRDQDAQKVAKANQAINDLEQKQVQESLQKRQALQQQRDAALGVKQDAENKQDATKLQNPNLAKLSAIWEELQKAVKAGVSEEHAKIVVKHIRQIVEQ